MAFGAVTISKACSDAWRRTLNTCATGRSVSISQSCCEPSRSCGRIAAPSEEQKNESIHYVDGPGCCAPERGPGRVRQPGQRIAGRREGGRQRDHGLAVEPD